MNTQESITPTEYNVIAPLIMGSGIGDGKHTACLVAQAATIDALRKGQTLDAATYPYSNAASASASASAYASAHAAAYAHAHADASTSAYARAYAYAYAYAKKLKYRTAAIDLFKELAAMKEDDK